MNQNGTSSMLVEMGWQGPVALDTPTSVPKENLLFLGSTWEPIFWVPNQFNFGRNAQNCLKLDARNEKRPGPCWWKQAMRDCIEMLLCVCVCVCQFVSSPHLTVKPRSSLPLIVLDYGLNSIWIRSSTSLFFPLSVLSCCVTIFRPFLWNRCMHMKQTPHTGWLFTPADSHSMTQSVKHTHTDRHTWQLMQLVPSGQLVSGTCAHTEHAGMHPHIRLLYSCILTVALSDLMGAL